MKAYPGSRAATSSDLEAVRNWLADEAMVQDRPVVLFQLACGRLFQLGLVRPGLTVIEQSLVGAAREAARVETARRMAPLLTDERCRMLDDLLVVDAELGMARATWLRQFPVQASPAAMQAEMDKLVFLRDLGVGGWDLSALPGKRVSTLAKWAQTASNQALAQSSPQRRYPALLAFASERLVGVTDGLVRSRSSRSVGGRRGTAGVSDGRLVEELGLYRRDHQVVDGPIYRQATPSGTARSLERRAGSLGQQGTARTLSRGAHARSKYRFMVSRRWSRSSPNMSSR